MRELFRNERGQIYLIVSLSISEQLAGIPEFASLGPLFKSSTKPLELTESETEYVVHCVKHVFAHHIVFQVIFAFLTVSFVTFTVFRDQTLVVIG